MNLTIKYIFGILIALRVIPFFAYAYIWFEPDPFYIQVIEFSSSIIFVLCSALVLMLFIQSKRRLFWCALWVLFECIYLTHAVISLFGTDPFISYLVMAGIITIPILSYKLKSNVFRYSYK